MRRVLFLRRRSSRHPMNPLQIDRTAYADLVSTLPLLLVARHPDSRQRERAVRAPFTPGFGVNGQISA
jgi:hypothetical protein